MNNKRLNEDSIVNELKGSSHFFQQEADSPLITPPSKDPASDTVTPPESLQSEIQGNDPSAPLEEHPSEDKPQTDNQANTPASSDASMLANYQATLVEEIRRTVKTLGKEVSFVRLTPEEKNQLVDIVYTYKRQGVKTSENEIHRIAVNCMLVDYKANGHASVLARVIAALLA